jgi:hypothetical protein
MVVLAVIGALAILALIFRLSGIRWVEWTVKIGGNDKPPNELNQ